MGWQIDDVRRHLKTFLRITAVNTDTDEAVTVECSDKTTAIEVEKMVKDKIAALTAATAEKSALLDKFKTIDLAAVKN